jgi:1,4-dihydroxy-6-naphthoate synthase
MRRLSLAYSPDTDDAFMVEALRLGLISHPDYEWEFYRADIQELNQQARQGRYDITAISVAAYPHIQDRYYLMPIGASIGNGFGPAIVVPEASPIQSTDELKGRRIAVPGLQTSAMVAARTLLGDFSPVPMPFDHIESALKRGEVDAGILIHELQLVFATRGLRSLGNLGAMWRDRYQLPLPLGANAIRRDLGDEVVIRATELYRQSIIYALTHRQEFVERASALAKEGLQPELGDRYIEMYVNQDSLEFSTPVMQSMKIMFANGSDFGLLPAVQLDRALIH